MPEILSVHEIVQPIFPFVSEVDPSYVEAFLNPMEFCEGIEGAQTLTLRLANEGSNTRIQRLSQRSWRTSELQGIHGAPHDVRALIFPLPFT